jgi:F-type H+-transporting ATPase subunit b
MAIFTAVVFLLLVVGLYLAAWKPIMEGLEKREHTIVGNIEAAERANAEAQLRLQEYEAKLAAAAEEATRMVAGARKDAEAAGERIIAAAQEEAARQRERTIADIDAAKRAALSELATKSTDVAMTLAQRIVGREVKAADHQNLIQDMLAQLPSQN